MMEEELILEEVRDLMQCKPEDPSDDSEE